MSNLPPVVAVRGSDIGSRRRLNFLSGGTGVVNADTLDLRFSDSHILSVAKDGPDFQTLTDAITHINTLGDASEDDPYLIRVGPGLWSGSFIIPRYCHVQGAGVGVTRFDKDYSVDAAEYILLLTKDTSARDLSVSFGLSFQVGIGTDSLQRVMVERIGFFPSTYAYVDLSFYTGPIEWYSNPADDFISFVIRDLSVDGADLTDLDGNVLVWVHGSASQDIPVHSAAIDGVRVQRRGASYGFGVAITDIRGASVSRVMAEGVEVSISVDGGDVGTPDGLPTAWVSDCHCNNLQMASGLVAISGCSFAVEPAGPGVAIGEWYDAVAEAKRVTGLVDMEYIASPAAPSAGHLTLYPKSDKHWWQTNNDGLESMLLTDADIGEFVVDKILTLSDSSVVVLASSGNVVTLT